MPDATLDLIRLLGEKEVQIAFLKQRIAVLEALLKQAQETAPHGSTN
jgi:hypothetical protein